MTETPLEVPADGGTAQQADPPAPHVDPPAPTTKPDGWSAPNPFADKKVGGSGNLDYADPDD